MSTQQQIPDGVRRVFAEGIRVADVPEPLAPFDPAGGGSGRKGSK
jgi:hypothetical protein